MNKVINTPIFNQHVKKKKHVTQLWLSSCPSTSSNYMKSMAQNKNKKTKTKTNISTNRLLPSGWVENGH